MAGRRISEDPFTRVSSPSRVRTSSPPRYTFTNGAIAAALEQLPLECGVTPGDVLQDLAHGLADSDHLALAADLGTQCGRDPDLGHACTPAQNST